MIEILSHLRATVLKRNWLRRGRLRDRLKHQGLFDPAWYLENNPDVAEAGHDPLAHYLAHGMAENRSPGPTFDADWYGSFYASRIAKGFNAASHYLLVGQEAGFRRLPENPAPPDESRNRILRRMAILRDTRYFDPGWYLDDNPDIARSKSNPFLHFASFGSLELRNPGPDFNAGWYQEEYLLEHSAQDAEPLFHFLETGEAAGLVTKPDDAYADWKRRYHEMDDDDVALLRAGPASRITPSLFIILYFADADESALLAFLASLAMQDQVAIKLAVIRDDADLIGDAARTQVESYGGVFAASATTALDVVKAGPNDIILLIDAHVRLSDHGLVLIPFYVPQDGPFIAYSDFETLNASGQRVPYFLPDYSPRLFEQIHERIAVVICNLGAIERVAAARHDLRPSDLLRARPSGGDVVFIHIDRFLHASCRPGGLVEVRAALRSLSDPDMPRIAIIIPTKNQFELLRTCVQSLVEDSDYDMSRVDIVLVDNGTNEPAAADYLAELAARGLARVLSYADAFNYSSINNVAVSHTDADILVFLNNDTKVLRREWLRMLVAELRDAAVGAVGAKLLFPDGTVQHGGVVIGIQGVAAHTHTHLPADDAGFQDLNCLTREVSAATGACLAMRRAVFAEVGGFDANLQIAFNDIALCLEIMRRGYRNVWIQEPLLMHFESKTRGYDLTPAQSAKFQLETLIFNRLYWSGDYEDPYYNPNLSLERPYALAEPPRQALPWRLLSREMRRRRIMMVSSTFQQGHGVAVVVALQSEHLLRLGYDVWWLGPPNAKEIDVPGVRRVRVSTPRLAARVAARYRMDIVVAHTPPFFSIARYIGASPVLVQYDYGEPPAELFPEVEARRAVKTEKTLAFAMAANKAAISRAVADENDETDVTVLPLANAHLAFWSDDLAKKRARLRADFGWDDAYVILSVCRFHKSERYYKGVGDFVDVTLRATLIAERKIVIVQCGKGDLADIEELEQRGVTVFANVSDATIADLYLAADLYVSLSKWEGYNLGIGQALAMGLPVLASKIPAHDAFGAGVETFLYQSDMLRRMVELARLGPGARQPRIVPWQDSLDRFSTYLDQCVEKAAERQRRAAAGRLSRVTALS